MIENLSENTSDPEQRKRLQMSLALLKKRREVELAAYKEEYVGGSEPEPENTNFDVYLSKKQEQKIMSYKSAVDDLGSLKTIPTRTEGTKRQLDPQKKLAHIQNQTQYNNSPEYGLISRGFEKEHGAGTRQQIQKALHESSRHDIQRHIEPVMENHINAVKSSSGVDVGFSKEELAKAYERVSLPLRGRAVVVSAVHPHNCTCRGCVTGETLQYDADDIYMKKLLKAGILTDER